MLRFEPNTKKQIQFSVPETGMQIPATVLCGKTPGKTIVISAGVHSREYIGIETTIRLAAQLDTHDLCGRVIFIHCLNYDGFIQRTPDTVPGDGKNLNREFPGRIDGTVTQKLAHFLEKEIIAKTDYLVDLHSGGFCEELTPHVYYQGTAESEVCALSERLAELTSAKYLVKSSSVNGFYGRAGQCGVPAIILERGGCGLVAEDEILENMRDVENILIGMGFLSGDEKSHAHVKIHSGFYEDSPFSGCWYPASKPGKIVSKGDELGQIRTIYGEVLAKITAKCDGVILYQTASLGIEANTPMVAYGELLKNPPKGDNE